MLSHFRCASLLFAALLAMDGYCDDWSFDDARSELGKFSLGFASGLVGHELGHYVVATSKGYNVSHDGFSIVYPEAAFTPSEHLQVASAGFQVQWVMAEFALRDSSGKELKGPPGNFGAGVVCAHLAITSAYLLFLKNNPQGDVVGIAQATGYSTDRIAMALAIPGALDAWRLFGNEVPEWVPQLSVLSKGVAMAWIWTY